MTGLNLEATTFTHIKKNDNPSIYAVSIKNSDGLKKESDFCCDKVKTFIIKFPIRM